MNKVIFTMRDGTKKEFDGERFTDEDMDRIFYKKCAGFCCYDCPVYDGVKCELNNYDLVKVERVIDKCGECSNKGNLCAPCIHRKNQVDNFKPKPKKVKKTYYFASWDGGYNKRRSSTSLNESLEGVKDLVSAHKNCDLQFHSIEVEVEE